MGLLFQGGHIQKGAVILFASHHGTVRNTAIIDYNPPKFSTAYTWVLFSGSNNLVEKCYFKGKTNLRPVLSNGEPDCLYNTVRSSYFKDIPLRAGINGREIVKVLGTGHVNAKTPGGAYFSLEGNLFEHADGEGAEIISLKSNFNRVLRNTILGSVGTLNIRRGSNNELRGNVILGQGVKGAGGIRMSGEHNLIDGNLVAGCEFGITLSSGEYWAKPLTRDYEVNDRDGSSENKARYPQNKHVTISNNLTFANSGPDLDVGVREYRKHWPENQNVLVPEECLIKDNRFVRAKGGVSIIGQKPEQNPPLDLFSFKPNTFAGNLLLGGKNDFPPAASGIQELALPADWSEAKALAEHTPLTPADVGPDWVRLKGL
jgi:poly(beta-D-mannuronate) lyase